MENGDCKFIGFGLAWSPKDNHVQPPASRKKVHIWKSGEVFPLALDQRTLTTDWDVDILASILILLELKKNQWQTSCTSQQLPGREQQREGKHHAT